MNSRGDVKAHDVLAGHCDVWCAEQRLFHAGTWQDRWLRKIEQEVQLVHGADVPPLPARGG